MLAYARERVQFGKPICEHPSIAHLLVDMDTRLNARGLLDLHAARPKGGRPAWLWEASQAKLYAPEKVERGLLPAAYQSTAANGYLEGHSGGELITATHRIPRIYKGTPGEPPPGE